MPRATDGDDELAGQITGRWDYGQLPPNVVLGRGCWLERRGSFERFRSRRRPGCVLHDGVQAYTWTTFNVEETGRVEIGARTILVGAVFMCAESISIGSDCVVSYGVTIADSDFHPRDSALRRADAEANAPGGDLSSRPPYVSRPVVVGDGVHIGIGAIVLKGVHIGHGARIAAGAVVSVDVPDGAVAVGNPAVVQAPDEL